MNFYNKILIHNSIKIFLFLFCSLYIQACSDSNFGRKLEDSFDSPLSYEEKQNSLEVKKEMSPALSKTENTLPKKKSINKSSILENKANLVEERKKKKNNMLSSKKERSFLYTPQPYRIILKLSAANPSAPAEQVTSVLREAGVVFEVEKIERFEEKKVLKNTSMR